MSLYKFQNVNDNSLSALDSYSAWFSKPQLFNDPFEGLFIEELREITETEIVKAYQYLAKKPERKKN